jgi:hypothetical protein
VTRRTDCGHNPTNGYICDDCWQDLPFETRWLAKDWDQPRYRTVGRITHPDPFYGPTAAEWLEFTRDCEHHWKDRPI